MQLTMTKRFEYKDLPDMASIFHEAEKIAGRISVGKTLFFEKYNEENRALHRDAALRTLEWATRHLDGLFMMLLDEVLYALQLGLLERRELENFLVQGKQKQVHLVLSGRALPSWLEDMADLVTEMREIKHPWRKGIKAQPGIEF